jgi:asparagine synthase (glutamine-hydrolysing)
MKDRLPSEIIKKPKQGFAIPFASWIRDKDFFRKIEEFFSEEFIERQDLFNYKYIKRLLDEHLLQKTDNRKKLGCYIMFQAWYRNIMM